MTLQLLGKDVIIITSLHYVFVEMLEMLYPKVSFIHTSVFDSPLFTRAVLLLDVEPTLKIPNCHKRVESIVVWGRVPHVNLNLYQHSQIIESTNVAGEIWAQFQKYWNDLKSASPSGLRYADRWESPWLSAPILIHIKNAVTKSNDDPPLNLPEFHPEDWKDPIHGNTALQVQCCFDHILHIPHIHSGSRYLTILLCIPRETILEIGQKCITSISQNLRMYYDPYYERELVIKQRIYRCLLIPAYFDPYETDVLLAQNPHIEMVVLCYDDIDRYSALHRIRSQPDGLFGEVTEDLKSHFQVDFYRCTKQVLTSFHFVYRKKYTDYMRRFVACQPFVEQDHEDESRLRESVKVILDDMKMDLSENISFTNVFKRIVSRLKTTQTIRYCHLNAIFEWVKLYIRKLPSDL